MIIQKNAINVKQLYYIIDTENVAPFDFKIKKIDMSGGTVDDNGMVTVPIGKSASAKEITFTLSKIDNKIFNGTLIEYKSHSKSIIVSQSPYDLKVLMKTNAMNAINYQRNQLDTMEEQLSIALESNKIY